MSTERILLLFFAGVVAGFINVNAGGGSLITLPVLIFLGLPASVANGTNRVGVLFQNILAIINFRRSGQRDFKLGCRLGFSAVLGAVLGSYMAIEVFESVFRSMLAVAMVMGLMVVLLRRRKTDETGTDSLRNPVLQMFLFFFIGIYGGLIQAGTGYLIIFSLSVLGDLSLKRTNSLKVIVIGIYLIPSLAIFIANGKVEWLPAVILAAGTGTGGWVGSTFSVERSEGWIKVIMAVAILGMAGKLLGLF